MLRNSMLAQLLALRSAAVTVVAQADALLAAASEAEDEAEPAPTGCQHPSDKITDTTTGGGSKPSFFCHGCKRTSDEIAADEGKT